MRNKGARLALMVVAALTLSLGGRALAAPKPIVFCMPDLDGHCRYCEIRFDPVRVLCVSG
jgi:hypothetical protein